ncbi:MAG: NUDIX domain-containing protein [Bacilli bacterium]|nr:NUDIX domain-containing protein [Bacilli bacterium]
MSYISELRKYVGHAPIMSPGATAIIYSKDKGILFEKRVDDGIWCLPGGALELKESFIEGLTREVKEETNLDIFDPTFLTVEANVYVKYPNDDEVYYTDAVYIVTKFSGDIKPDEESSELHWFKLDELPNNIEEPQREYINLFIEKKDD